MIDPDYSPDTLRGALARVVQARAEERINESSKGYLEVSLDDVATIMDNDYRNYDKLLEVMDYYFDDWANAVAEALGVPAE